MSLELRSGTDKLSVNSGKAARVALYDAYGNPVGETGTDPVWARGAQRTPYGTYPGDIYTWHPYAPVPGSFNPSVGAYAASSFRIPGVAATSQVLMTFQNTYGASKGAVIRDVKVDFSTSVAGASTFLVNTYFRLWINTGTTPSGGTAASKALLQSIYTGTSNMGPVFAASADGTASTITHATPSTPPSSSAAHWNVQTAVGDAGNWKPLFLQRHKWKPKILLFGETAALILIGSANNLTTNHYTVSVVWEEFFLS